MLLTDPLLESDTMGKALGVVVRLTKGWLEDVAASRPLECTFLATVNVQPENRQETLVVLPTLRASAIQQSYPPDGCWTADARMMSEGQSWHVS